MSVGEICGVFWSALKCFGVLWGEFWIVWESFGLFGRVLEHLKKFWSVWETVSLFFSFPSFITGLIKYKISAVYGKYLSLEMRLVVLTETSVN